MKLKAVAVRKRLDMLIDDEGRGRVIVMGDFNDGPELDVEAQMIEGGFSSRSWGRSGIRGA